MLKKYLSLLVLCLILIGSVWAGDNVLKVTETDWINSDIYIKYNPEANNGKGEWQYSEDGTSYTCVSTDELDDDFNDLISTLEQKDEETGYKEIMRIINNVNALNGDDLRITGDNIADSYYGEGASLGGNGLVKTVDSIEDLGYSAEDDAEEQKNNDVLSGGDDTAVVDAGEQSNNEEEYQLQEEITSLETKIENLQNKIKDRKILGVTDNAALEQEIAELEQQLEQMKAETVTLSEGTANKMKDKDKGDGVLSGGDDQDDKSGSQSDEQEEEQAAVDDAYATQQIKALSKEVNKLESSYNSQCADDKLSSSCLEQKQELLSSLRKLNNLLGDNTYGANIDTLTQSLELEQDASDCFTNIAACTADDITTYLDLYDIDDETQYNIAAKITELDADKQAAIISQIDNGDALNLVLEQSKTLETTLKACGTDKDCQAKVKKQIEDLTNTINSLSESQMLTILSSGSEISQEIINNLVVSKECGDGFFGGICSYLTYSSSTWNAQKILSSQLTSTIASMKADGANKNEINEALSELLAASIDGLEYDDGTYTYNGEKYTSMEELEAAIDAEVEATCTDSSSKDCQNAQVAQRLAETKRNKEQVSVGWTYSIIDAIKNPDSQGLKTAELFGFEDDYSNVPEMLKESFPSQLCLDKIDGYLDKTIESNGGVTAYGCSSYNETDKESDDNDRCLEVLGDLRAQRSAITPDNKTIVTYSYYIKGTSDTSSYKLYVKYTQGGTTYQHIIKEGNVGSQVKGYDSETIPLNHTGAVNTNSFTINIDAGGLQLTYPIILIGTESLSSTIANNGNSQGNEDAQITLNSD